MSNSKNLASILIGIIILSFVYIGNFSVPLNLESEILDYFGMTVQAATSTGVTLSTIVNVQLTVSVDNASVDFGSLTPGTPIYSSTSLSINTNNPGGYNVKINRNNSTSTTMTLGGLPDATNTIPDYTPPWLVTDDGNATSSETSLAANLSFRVRLAETSTSTCGTTASTTAWWGSNDVAGTAKYAGFPTSTTNTTTFNCPTFTSATTTAKHYYRLDAPIVGQYIGSYSGGITFTAIAN